MQPSGRCLEATPGTDSGHLSVLVSEAAGSRDHKRYCVEFVPMQWFVLVQVLIEGQAVETQFGDLCKGLFLGDRRARFE
jgi:hypothetical protein